MAQRRLLVSYCKYARARRKTIFRNNWRRIKNKRFLERTISFTSSTNNTYKNMHLPRPMIAILRCSTYSIMSIYVSWKLRHTSTPWNPIYFIESFKPYIFRLWKLHLPSIFLILTGRENDWLRAECIRN